MIVKYHSNVRLMNHNRGLTRQLVASNSAQMRVEAPGKRTVRIIITLQSKNYKTLFEEFKFKNLNVLCQLQHLLKHIPTLNSRFAQLSILYTVVFWHLRNFEAGIWTQDSRIERLSESTVPWKLPSEEGCINKGIGLSWRLHGLAKLD